MHAETHAAAKVLLIVTDVTRPAPASDLLAGLFDLTPAEARVARSLASGLTLEQIAKTHSVSINTARNQLASLFQKTGAQRQSQLVLLFSGASGVVKEETSGRR